MTLEMSMINLLNIRLKKQSPAVNQLLYAAVPGGYQSSKNSISLFQPIGNVILLVIVGAISLVSRNCKAKPSNDELQKHYMYLTHESPLENVNKFVWQITLHFFLQDKKVQRWVEFQYEIHFKQCQSDIKRIYLLSVKCSLRGRQTKPPVYRLQCRLILFGQVN